MLKTLRYFLSTFSAGELVVFCLDQWAAILVRWIPGFSGMLLRTLYYKITFKRLAGFAMIRPSVVFEHSYGIQAGKNLHVNYFSFFDARGGIEIGDDVLIGPHCAIVSSNHSVRTRPGEPRLLEGQSKAPVVIGSNVWIGAHVTIIGPCRIGDAATIGAGAVVRGDIAASTVYTALDSSVSRVERSGVGADSAGRGKKNR